MIINVDMIYNYYISKSDIYDSEIAIINTPKPVHTKVIYYISSKNEKYLKSGFYVDNDDMYLSKIFNEINEYKKVMSDNYIENIHKTIRHYTYVKILKDTINPQLEDKKMIFYFGKSICDKFISYSLTTQTNKYYNTFNIKKIKKHGFTDFSNSQFTNNNCKISDNFDLSINLNFKVFNKLKLDRRCKIKNIIKNSI